MLENINTAAAVIGHPIKHSRSPLIHNIWLEQHNISGIYDALDVDPKHLEHFCNDLRNSELSGINITLPHKKRIMAFCDDIDETARQIGAVNTIKIKDQKLFATNTDAYGFVQNLKDNYSDFDLSSSKAVVLGAGGASRAIIYGLIKAGVQNITLTNRTYEKSEEILNDFNKIDIARWEDRNDILSNCTLLINTTSLGMDGYPILDIDITKLPSDSLLYDLIYNPFKTSFLQNGSVQGHKIINGLGMLAYQAQKAFEIWFDVLPDVSRELMEKLEDSL